MSDLCKNCGKSIWLHDFMDYSGECDNECEEFEVDEDLQQKQDIHYVPTNS